MTDWARRDSHGSNDPHTWARRLKQLRSFARWLQQFEPRTEVPDDTIFGRLRRAPGAAHLQRAGDRRSAGSRAAAWSGAGLRGVVFETLFGLIASCGLRIGRGAVAAQLLMSISDAGC